MYTKLAKKEDISQKIYAESSKFGFSWLDSTLQLSDKGKNSYLFTNPIVDLYLQNGEVVCDFIKKELAFDHTNDIFKIAEQLVHVYDLKAVGYISYESALNRFGIASKQEDILPSVRFFFYNEIQEIDNYSFEQQNLFDRNQCSTLVNSISKSEYISNVQKIKEYIHEGDIYQANYTTRFKLSSSYEPFETYLRLRELNQSPYSSFLNFGNYQILSSSPERMFSIINNRITTCPIKGTIALGNNEEEQNQNLHTLLNSYKDKAELLMIVDLMRNDLGKIAQTGSVSVDSLFKPEFFSSLIHLVSDISANLKPGTTFSDIVHALIPGGSITGAPKKRAIEIINELETYPRFVYTGSIGYMTKETIDFNIAIRTMYQYDNNYYIHAGGGIVADSDPEAEYNEMLLKAKNLFKAVGYNHD